MKKNQLLLIVILAVTVASCMMSGSSGESDANRKDVVGSWQIAGKSYETIKDKNEEKETQTVLSFQLKADSTGTMVYEMKNRKNEIPITWTWKAEKKLGSENFGVSMKSDVVIRGGGFTMLGLMIEENAGKLNLKSSDYLFEKD
ncbi:hypothetical protein SAMN05444280_13426 [Tangfeifania diversioriginum]|uniref:Lipocalin-like domain-containing protein n=2 Tax=Tangfeifania diversioriginum TaxID=1168035 RepID=A0A1M6MN28_9BACT|nr:hypothetical protein SAMN05444280_13426 [Tangfeifania diversioriginum]